MYEAKIETIRSRAVRESTAQKAKQAAVASSANPSSEGSNPLNTAAAVDLTVILEISVSDTGIGIPLDRLPKLFKSFSQIDISTARRYGGTGLGLAISSTLVNHMGGGLWVESEEGVGSRFALTIPMVVAPNQPDTPGNRSSDGWTPLTSPPSPCSTSSEGTSGTQSLTTERSQDFTSPASGCLSPAHSTTQEYFSQPVANTTRSASPASSLVAQSSIPPRPPAIAPLTWPLPTTANSSFHLGMQPQTKKPVANSNTELTLTTSKPPPMPALSQYANSDTDQTGSIHLGMPTSTSQGLKPQTSDVRSTTDYAPSANSSSPPRITIGKPKPYDDNQGSDSPSGGRSATSLLTSAATSGGQSVSQNRTSRASVAKQHHHHRRGGTANEENLALSFPIKILLAEDNVLNQKIAISILKRLGYTNVEIANNGREVLDAMRRTRFDLIFVGLLPLTATYERTLTDFTSFSSHRWIYTCRKWMVLKSPNQSFQHAILPPPICKMFTTCISLR